MERDNYRPLPYEVTVKNSPIEGLGLFSTQIISKGTNLGVSHVENTDFEDKRIRTPLGGFINHSNEPNSELIQIGQYYYLLINKDVMPDEEILLKYTLYDV
jgi:SET domain-containing protein